MYFVARLGLAGVLAAASLTLMTGRVVTQARVLERVSQTSTGTQATLNFPSAACSGTLQACISSAASGDTVIIAPGTYLTNSLTISRAIRLIGGGTGPGDVVLEATAGRVISYSSSVTGFTPVISNVTIAGGNAGVESGGGVRISASTQVVPIFHSIIFRNNIGRSGGALRSTTVAPVTMINVQVLTNTSTAGGGGVSISGTLTIIDSVVRNNIASTSGGGAEVNGATVASNTRFEDNVAGDAGGAIETDGDLTLTDVTARNNRSTIGAGGGFRARGVTSVTRGVVENNSSVGNGGGMSVFTLTLNSVSVISNVSGARGGGFFANGPVTVLGGTYRSNSSASLGGGGYAGIGVTVTDGLFEGNTSESGGGLYVDSSGPGSVTNVRFIKNTAQGRDGSVVADTGSQGNAGLGGALYASSSMIIRDSLFEGNVARGGNGGAGSAVGGAGGAGSGGAIYSSVDANIENTRIYSNSAIGGLAPASAAPGLPGPAFGGGVRGNVVLTLTAVQVLGNQAIGATSVTPSGADASGGGVYGGNVSVADVLIENNNARGGACATIPCTVGGEGSGGGLLSTTSADIRATRFISNFASENGGGAALQIATLTESLFERNVAQQRGGGLAVCCGLTTATRVTFTQNLAAAGGGAIVVESLGSLRLTESTLLRNSASNGAGQALAISQSGGLVYVGNSQIVDESVLSTSDVIRLSGVSSAAQIVNNTVVGNGQGHMIGQIQTSPRAASVINNVIAGFAVGIFGTANNIEVGNNLYFTVPVSRTANVIDLGGSVVADPLFVDAANGNYHIKPASPAVNAGRATDLTIDIDGQQRPWGVAVDIGFDEIDPATIPPPVTPTPPLPPVQKIYVPFVIR